MAEMHISRNQETGEFSVGNGPDQIPHANNIDISAYEHAQQLIHDQHDSGQITDLEMSAKIRDVSNLYDQNARFEDSRTFYGQALKIDLADRHDLVITPEALASVAAIDTDTLQSPQHSIVLDGVKTLTFTPEAVAGFNLDSFRSENEVVGLDDGKVVLTNTDTYEMREADEWLNGEVFQFGDENGIKFVLNDIGRQDVGVESLVIGDTEINFGERMARYNELSNSGALTSETESAANRSEQLKILVDLHEDIRSAMIDTMAPSSNSVAPSTQPALNRIAP